MITVECKECGNEISHFSKKQEGCTGCELAELRFYFEDRWSNGGSLMRKLCETIVVADLENLGHIYKAFPKLVDGYWVYATGKTWTDRINAGND